MKIATPPTSTGNPGQPRDLQFRGPFLEMFFDRGIMGLRPTQGDEKRLKGTAFRPSITTTITLTLATKGKHFRQSVARSGPALRQFVRLNMESNSSLSLEGLQHGFPFSTSSEN
jgi:hypothetical protein